MLVDNLNDMAAIVNKNKNLDWDGWDVVQYVKSSNAEFSNDGVFKDGIWYKKKTFILKKSGWTIPDSLAK